MKVLRDVPGMQAEADAARAAGETLVLVPTMGSLHAGHLELVRRARDLGSHVTVSVFVNPTQFAPGEDYERYPRDLERDMDLLAGIGGVEAIYSPPPNAMYTNGMRGLTWVTVDEMGQYLCGPNRDGHFRGVTTIVTKLFHACRPHIGVFGLKDAQQFFMLRRMTNELDFGIELVGVETVREPDGLAMSSRNRYLGPAEREQAVALSGAVFGARKAIEGGEIRPERVIETMKRSFDAVPLVQLEYAELVDADILQPVDRLEKGQTVVAAVAAQVGRARLIDNAIVDVP